MTAPTEPRQTCFVCFKPQVTCICRSFEPVDNRTRVFVLQHPRERGHPIGTARFVDLGLAKSEVVVAANTARDLVALMDVPEGTGLLYPRADSQDLEEVPPEERPKHLLVLDGTWPQARALYRQNPWLTALPHYRLSPSAPSRYRIRKEPSAHCLSTIESVLLALRILEPETEGFPKLLAAFDAMIDTQVRHTKRAIAAGTGQRHKRSRKTRRFHGMPRWLGEGYEDLIGVYAEALPVEDGTEPGPRHLLQLTAVRFSTGECYERMVAPHRGLATNEALAVVGLHRRDFDQAIAPDQLAADFANFVGDGQVCLAWNGTTPSLMHDTTGVAHRIRLLKSVDRSAEMTDGGPFHEAGASPSLDRLVALAREGALITPLVLRGRASQRLANLWSLAEWLRERGRSPVDVE